MNGKPTVPEVTPLVKAVYNRSSVGCCWHILLDDGNVDDKSVRSCTNNAIQHQHPECLALIEPITAMSKTQRLKLGGTIDRFRVGL